MNLSALAAHLRMTAQMIEDLLAFGIQGQTILSDNPTTQILEKFRSNGRQTAAEVKERQRLNGPLYARKLKRHAKAHGMSDKKIADAIKSSRKYKRNGLHWTQRPENKQKLLKMVLKGTKTRSKQNGEATQAS